MNKFFWQSSPAGVSPGLLALDRYRPSTWVTDWTEDMGDTYRADLRRVRALEGNVTHGATPRVRAALEQARDQYG